MSYSAALLVLLMLSTLVQPSSCVPILGYRVVRAYPHDTGAFTQGLAYEGGVLYEGTGGYGGSSIRRVDLETGAVQRIRWLDGSLFGEGVALWKDDIIQLTWRSGTGLVYDRENLTPTGRFSYSTEGWGIASDGVRLFMSDGTERLYVLDPGTFEVTGVLEVTADGSPLGGLNELEYIDGEIFANLWPTDRIAILSPETGEVRAFLDLQGLLTDQERRGADVLNGIAYDREGERIFVTGKLWPKLFHIQVLAG